MTGSPRPVALVSAAILFLAISAGARAEDIGAKKILIKDNLDPTRRQILLLSLDPGVQLSDVDDPAARGAWVHVYSATDDLCVRLARGNLWENTGTIWKYSNHPGKNRVKLSAGKLKIKIKDGVTYTLADDASQGMVSAQFQFGQGTQFCMQCSAPVRDDTVKFIGKDCPAVACADEPSPCSCGSFLMSWGCGGCGGGSFGNPIAGIAVDGSGNVFVADESNHRIIKFTDTGSFVTEWGSMGSGDGQFNFPFAVAVDAGGNVYVADGHNHRIQKFDNGGTFLTKWGSMGGGDGQFNFAAGVAVDSSQNVFAVDMFNSRIQKFTDTGTYLTQWGIAGSGNGQFNVPRAVEVDANGDVYVADYSNSRIQKFTGTGTYLTQWGSFGTGDGQFNGPSDVAVDAGGGVLVADENNHRIQKFDAAGNFVVRWGDVLYPHHLAVDENGNVFVMHYGEGPVVKFRCPISTSTSTTSTSTSSTTTST